MKVVIDMNLSPRWVKMLTDAGFEARHWSNCGSPDAPDSEIMAFAAADNYVVLTHDLDFGAILASTQGKKPSVIQIRADDVSPENLGALVTAAFRQASSELEIGALLSIDAKRTRMSILPLQPRG